MFYEFSFSILDASTSSLSKPSAISSQKRIVLEDRQLVKDLFREHVRDTVKKGSGSRTVSL